MSDNEFILRLFTLALLVGFLIQRQWERLRVRRLNHRSRARHDIHPINVAPLQPRLNEVRRDFASAAHERARPVKAHAGMLAEARRRLAALGFFRHPTEGG